jgi:hypothetical protein
METEAARATTMCDIIDKAKDFAKDFLERRCNFEEVGSANLKGGTGETIRVESVARMKSIVVGCDMS